MKAKITGATIEPGEHVWLAPDGLRGKKLITVTSITRNGDAVIVRGHVDGKPVVATTFSFAPVDIEM